MKLKDIEGNPQIEAFSSIPVTDVLKELGISIGSPSSHWNGAGRSLAGDSFWNTWIELIGLKVEEIPNGSPWPCMSLGPLHYQLWRSRVFYLNKQLLDQALVEPFRLDLSKPTIPFAEVLWQPQRGIQKSLRGLEDVPSSDLVKVAAALARMLKAWTSFGKVGRPPETTEQFLLRLSNAAGALRSTGQNLSKPNLAKAMNVDLRWLQRLMRKHVKEWPKLRAELQRQD